MPTTRKKKEETLEKLTDGLKGAVSAVFVNFHKLLVAEATELRKKLREGGIKYSVIKKTLAKRALAEQSYKGETPELKGELAIAWSCPPLAEAAGDGRRGEDAIAPAREINEFEKKFKEKVKIL